MSFRRFFIIMLVTLLLTGCNATGRPTEDPVPETEVQQPCTVEEQRLACTVGGEQGTDAHEDGVEDLQDPACEQYRCGNGGIRHPEDQGPGDRRDWIPAGRPAGLLERAGIRAVP